MRSFREALDFCQLRRILFIGCKYTWDNRREEGENMKLVLDKGLLNSFGFTEFPQTKLKYISNLVLDHLCLLMALNGFTSCFRENRNRRFHFEIA